MDRDQKRIAIILIMFFGWILSSPFNGPILEILLENTGYQTNKISLNMTFILFHALGYILTGPFKSLQKHWKSMMLLGGATCFLVSLLLGFLDSNLWFLGYALMGVGSSLFVLGWSYPYTYLIKSEFRLKFMASVIIWSNVVLILFTFLGHFVPYPYIYLLSLIPL